MQQKTATTEKEKYTYNRGFGNHFSSEAIPHALPEGQNNPQQCPMGLYCEQISGTAFTEPRASNQRTWVYRIRPSVCHRPFTPYKHPYITNTFESETIDPNQKRWMPFPLPDESEKFDWVDGLRTLMGAGSPMMKTGIAIYIYTANVAMEKRSFTNSDGDMLIVPQLGGLDIKTELGCMEVDPGEITVIPRGIRFSISPKEGTPVVRGYVLEVFEGHFKLPDLGPIGSNGLANPRDFLTPNAYYEDITEDHSLINKFIGKMFVAKQNQSPFNVAAWHGNYVPYKYDLSLFCCMNSVTYDHPDPSIYTVLTCQTPRPGVAAADFVIFPPRWEVKEHTFRPPWFHRNCMSEFMGLIKGVYEAKQDGFLPGGASLHSCMIAHGPDSPTFEKETTKPLEPAKIPDNSLAFMFESTFMLSLTDYAKTGVDEDYFQCWQGLESRFDKDAI